jgi:hypothetical protein
VTVVYGHSSSHICGGSDHCACLTGSDVSHVTGRGHARKYVMRMRSRKLRNILNLICSQTQKRIEMFYSTNQSHHWKLNQSDYKKRTNQIPHTKNEQPITAIVIIDFSYVSLVPKIYVIITIRFSENT